MFRFYALALLFGIPVALFFTLVERHMSFGILDFGTPVELIWSLIAAGSAFVLVSLLPRIVLHVVVDEETDQLEISYIGRFRIQPKTLQLRLSRTIIFVEVRENTDEYGTVTRTHVVHLTAEGFGTIALRPRDFGPDIDKMADYFERFKLSRAARLRKKRLSKR